MDIEIKDLEEGSNKVEVTFKINDLIHSRYVNIIFDEEGEYDKEATKNRVNDVARGVKVKYENGILS